MPSTQRTAPTPSPRTPQPPQGTRRTPGNGGGVLQLPNTPAPRTPTPRRPIPVANQRPNGVTDTPWTGGAYTGAKPTDFNIPDFVTGADDNDRWSRYLQYLAQNPGARGNRILHNMTGFNQQNGYTPRPTPTPGGGAPTPGAGPGPIAGGPTPGGPPPRPTQDPRIPPGYPSSGGAGELPVPYAFNDPFQGVLSMIPVMNANLHTQIGGAMADAGMSGNRYGTFAAERAGQLGAENAQMQNAMLNNAYLDYANQQENRALQATGQATGLGGLQDQIAQNHLTTPFGIGSWEQGRQDAYGRLGLDQFNQDKLGWLPYLLQAATSQGAGSPGQVYTTQTPSQPGAADYFSLIASLFG